MKGQLKRLRKEPEVLDEYDSIIKEQLNSGVIEKVAELEETEKVHYLPHHAVIRKDAETITNCLRCFVERKEKRDLLK